MENCCLCNFACTLSGNWAYGETLLHNWLSRCLPIASTACFYALCSFLWKGEEMQMYFVIFFLKHISTHLQKHYLSDLYQLMDSLDQTFWKWLLTIEDKYNSIMKVLLTVNGSEPLENTNMFLLPSTNRAMLFLFSNC